MSGSSPIKILREREFAWYFWGRLISTAGSVMAPVALTFAVLDVDSSPSALGMVLAAHSIPLVLFLLIGGVVSDRMSRSMVMQVSHLLSAATQGVVAVLVLTGSATIAELVVLEAVNGVVSAFTFPAMVGVVPQLVRTGELQQANALLSFTRSGLSVIGPSIAAGLVVTVGSGWALAFDALTWLVASVCMSRLRLPAGEQMRTQASSMITDLREGWVEFTSRTWLWVVVLAFGLLNAIQAGAWFTLGPVIARSTSLGPRGWGIVLSAESVGVVLVTLVLMRLKLSRPLRSGMLGVGAIAVPMLLLGLAPALLPLAAAAFLAGAGTEVFGIGWQTAMQENVPQDVLSRVSSYDALGSFVAIPIGELSYGWLAGAFGVRDLVVASAALYAVVTALTLCSRSVRRLGRVAAQPPEPGDPPDPADAKPAKPNPPEPNPADSNPAQGSG